MYTIHCIACLPYSSQLSTVFHKRRWIKPLLKLINAWIYAIYQLFILFILSYPRWLLWFNAKADNSWRMGMGLVVGDRCATSIIGSNDTESNVWKCGNIPRCAAYRNRCCTMQNHEGTFDRSCKNKTTHAHTHTHNFFLFLEFVANLMCLK